MTGRIYMYKKFEKWLKFNEWQVEVYSSSLNCTNNDVLKKFCNIPESFLNFLQYFKSITSKDETTWFLCANDYADETDDAFKWNEFELMSLEAADSDKEWKKSIKEWWNNRLPIILSVKDGYSFWAIDLSDGTIVRGGEPEFEEVSVIADNFEEFIDMIMNNTVFLQLISAQYFKLVKKNVSETKSVVGEVYSGGNKANLDGVRIINKKYAGKTYELSGDLGKKYPDGVKFSEEGFPDFEPYSIKKVIVHNLEGDTYYDFTKANEAA